MWATKEGGFFDGNGLNVDLQLIPTATGMAALVSGQTQISGTGGGETFNAVSGGADLVVLANPVPVPTLSLEVAPDIKTKEDLVGKKIGITRLGSTSDLSTRKGLKAIGLNPDKDVVYVQLDTNTAATTALLAGAIQGAAMSVPDTLNVESKGFHPLFDLSTMNIPSALSTVYAAQRPWVNAHHAETQKFIDSIVQGIARFKKDRDLGTSVIKKYYKLEDQAALSATYDYYAKTIAALPYLAPDQFSDVLALAGKPDYDVNKILDNTFVKSAEDRGLAR